MFMLCQNGNPMNIINIFPPVLSGDQEKLLTLLETGTVRIEQIISNGQPSPDQFWYDQNENEWVLLLNGTAVLKYADQSLISLNAGDSLQIPAYTKHRIESVSSDAIWLAVYYN